MLLSRPFAALLAASLIALLFPARPAQAQLLPGSDEPTPDSVATRLGLPEGHSPNGALRRALVAPGWGQYYNRQYWKMPVVVAGLGGVIFALIYTWDQYLFYRNAWRYRRIEGNFLTQEQYQNQFGDDGPTYYTDEKYASAYQALRNELALGEEEDLPAAVQDQREQYRRWGEFSILGVGAFWLLQVADAYVNAHLLGFEVEEVSMQVRPGRRGSLTGRLRVSL